jgi:hypothetical protein
MLRIRFALGSLAVLAGVVVACTETSTTTGADSQGLLGTITAANGVADTGEFEICKHGTASLFRITIDGAKSKLSLGAGQCQVLATSAGLGVGQHTVKVVEDAMVGTVLDSIVAESVSVRFTTPSRSSPITGTNTITEIFDGDQGWLIDFYNSPVP